MPCTGKSILYDAAVTLIAVLMLTAASGCTDLPASEAPGQDRAPTSTTSALNPTTSTAAPKAQSRTKPPHSAKGQAATVVEVVDGDTIKVKIKGRLYTVRYIGVDTPETHHPRVGLECFGKRAAAANDRMAAGKTVELEKDLSNTDRYGRLLRYVWIDGKMINRELVARGFAVSSSYPPDIKRQDEFRAAEIEARAKKLGLWSACGGADTPAGGQREKASDFEEVPRQRDLVPQGKFKLPACAKNDCDCKNFNGDEAWATWFMQIYDKNNSHRLDGDHDGTACEGN